MRGGARARGRKKAPRKKRPASPKKAPPAGEQVLFIQSPLGAARSEVPFMQELFRTFPGVELLVEEVASRAELERALALARRSRRIRAVHLVAHGRSGGRGATIELGERASLDLASPATRRLFYDLEVESLFLSACDLGADRRLLARLRRHAQVDALFAYVRDVDDYQAFLIESLFYHLAYGYVRGRLSRVNFKEVHARLTFVLDYLGIDAAPEPLVNPLLAAVFAE